MILLAAAKISGQKIYRALEQFSAQFTAGEGPNVTLMHVPIVVSAATIAHKGKTTVWVLNKNAKEKNNPLGAGV